MKKITIALSIVCFSTAGYSQKEIKVEEAKNNVGDTVKICAKILTVAFDENSKGSPTWFYTTADNTNPPLSFVIWGEKRKNFDYKPEKDLKDRDVCISGKIELLKDKPIMVIDKQSQIDIK